MADSLRLFNVRTVAERLQTSPDTVYRLIADGELQAIDIGRDGRVRRRVREDALQSFIDSRSPITK